MKKPKSKLVEPISNSSFNGGIYETYEGFYLRGYKGYGVYLAVDKEPYASVSTLKADNKEIIY